MEGSPEEFEYWSLARDKKRKDDNGFGYVLSPFKTKQADGIEKDDFLDVTEGYLNDALRLQAIREYTEWVEHSAVSMTMRLREVRGIN